MATDGDPLVTLTPTERDRRTPLLRLPRRRRSQPQPDVAEPPAPVAAVVQDASSIELAPQDAALAYFQSHPGPVDLDALKLDSPGIRSLREAGVKLVVPLVSQGELIGLLNLGARLSEQEYSGDDRKLLENLAGQAAPALRVAQLVREQAAEVRRRERYEQELHVAQLIQEHFLPSQLPELPQWNLAAYYRPAREVGGDFYDVIELPGDELGIIVGDVTDKGVPAALVMASTRSVVRSSAARLISPGEVLARVNDLLAADIPPNMFVTCLYGVLSPATGRFRFANAGHNLPAVQSPGGILEPRATGMPLGLLPGCTYDEAEVTIEPGCSLVLYSDALPEAHDPDGEMFGFPRVLAVVGAAGEDGDVDVIGRLLRDLEGFTGQDWEQEDDITIVSLDRLAGRGSSARGVAAPLAVEAHAAEDDPGRVLAEFSVSSRPGNEREALRALRTALDAAPEVVLPADRLASLETALAEATMNAIEHGNQNMAELLVEVRVWADEQFLVVRVTDQGRGGAVPDDLEEPDIEAKLRGEQGPRGWGLFLIKNMVDDLRVSYDADQHIVELVMRLDGGPA